MKLSIFNVALRLDLSDSYNICGQVLMLLVKFLGK